MVFSLQYAKWTKTKIGTEKWGDAVKMWKWLWNLIMSNGRV